MTERMEATIEDLREAESVAEIEVYEELLQHEDFRLDPSITMLIEEKKRQIGSDPIKVLAQYAIELEELKRGDALPVRQVTVRRSTKQYRLLKKEVEWSTTPQVHAVMLILCSVVEVGNVVGEDLIIEAMELNREVLQTRQTGKKIWDYYKSGSIGLLAHGNIEVA